MQRHPPISTRTDTLFPYTTLFRSRPLRLSRLFESGQTSCRAGHRTDAQPQDGAIALSCGSPHFPGWHWQAEPERAGRHRRLAPRSEEHTSELQSLMRISYAVFCLKNKKTSKRTESNHTSNTQVHTRTLWTI